MTGISLDDLLGPKPKASEKDVLWEFIYKMMNRFYDDKEIWRKYGWALRLKRINPRQEMFNAVSTTFNALSPGELRQITEDVHELSRKLP